MNTSRWLKTENLFFIFVFILLNTLSAFAGPSRTTYQAKIIKPDGYPLEAANVNFKFTILDPIGSCILYSETYSSVNMASTGGVISFSLGSGVKTFPVSATTFENVFSNITPVLSCDAGGPGTYSPGADDIRKIVMQFHDGSGWQTLPAMSINAVPYAMYANDAQKLEGKSASDFVQVSTLASCGTSEALRFNGTSFSCISVNGSGAVTSGAVVTALGYTPADGASVTAVTSYASNVSSTVFSVSSTVSALSNTVSSLQTSVAASFAAMVSSQWISSGTALHYTAGSVGIGTATPVTALDVSGGVRIGTESATCAPSFAGTLRYNSGVVEYCNGTSWTAFGVSGAGILAINGLTSGSQTFSFGSAGTSPSVSSVGSVHTFNFPFASVGTTTAGLISNADYVNFSNKITSSAAGIAQVLGYTPASASALANYLTKANNLSDLTSSATARTNLGVGYIGTLASVDLSSADVSGTLAIARTPSYTGDVTKAAASNTLILSNTGVVAGTYNKVTVDAKGRVTSSSSLSTGDVTTALGYTPASASASSQWTTSGTTIHYTNGNVSIGTVSASARLHIYEINPTDGQILLQNNSSAATEGVDFAGASGARTGFVGMRGSFSSAPTPSSKSYYLWSDFFNAPMIFGTNNTERMRIDGATGNVGIGTTDPALGYPWAASNRLLTVEASGTSGSNLSGGLILANGGTMANNYEVGHINFFARQNGTVSEGMMARMTARASGAGGANGFGSVLLFYTRPDNTPGGALERLRLDANGNFGIGTNNPSAKLHIAAGTSATAALKFASGTTLNTPQAGVMEYDGTGFYLTDGTLTRRMIATSTSSGSLDNASIINSTGNMSLVPVGSVVVSSTTASTNSQTGSLIVKGGIGISGNTYSSGTIITSSNIQGSEITATSATITPYVYGSTAAAGNLRLDSTTNASKGFVLMSPNGGNVGIGTSSPEAALNVVGSIQTGMQSGLFSTVGSNSLVFQRSAASGTFSYIDQKGIGGAIMFRTSKVGTQDVDAMTIVASGSVGIGTTNPNQGKLQIVQSADTSSGGLTVVNTAGSMGVRLWADGSQGSLDVNSGGTGNLVINRGGGHVGIGTPAPNGVLHIADSSVADIRLENTGATSSALRILSQNGVNYFESGASFGAGSNADIRFTNMMATTTWMTLQASTGNVGIGTTAPTAKLHIPAGTSATAALKFASGTILNSPQAGAMEYDGSGFYLTDGGGTRRMIATSVASGSLDNASIINSTGNMSLVPVGSVIVSSTTASTNSTTGALIVNGGTGIAGNLNVAGSISTNSSLTVSNSSNFVMRASSGSPNDPGDIVFQNVDGSERSRIYSGTGASGSLLFSVGPTPSTKMTILDSGYVGIGTTAPSYNLHVSGTAGMAFERSGKSIIFNPNFVDANTHAMISTGRAAASTTMDLRLQAGNDDSSNGVVIKSTGKVGIGTSSPSSLFHVVRSPGTTIGQTSSSTANAGIIVEGGGTGLLAIDGNEIQQFGDTLYMRGEDGLYFSTGDPADGDAITPMTISRQGKIGFGTATPLVWNHFNKSTTMGSIGSLNINNAIVRIQESASMTMNFDGNTIVAEDDMYLGTKGSGTFQIFASEVVRINFHNNGNTGIAGTFTPTAKLHIAAGSSTANTAPLKFTSGTLMSAAQAGAMEYDGAGFYLTDGAGTRRMIATGSSSGSLDNASIINSTGNMNLVPVGSVIVSSTVASTNSQTGALIVKGGMGIAGNLYSSGTIITSSNIQGASITATSGMMTPYIYGSTSASGNITIESTTHSTKGYVLLAPNGGRIGIGTSAPAATLHLKGPDAANLVIERDTTLSAGMEFRNQAGSMFAGVNNTGSFGISTGPNLNAATFVYSASGSVGIGTNLPGAMLDVRGTANFQTSTTGAFRVTGTGTGYSDAVSGIFAVHSENTAGSGGNVFKASSAFAPNAFIVKDSGNIGIGTSTPIATLDIRTTASSSVGINAGSIELQRNEASSPSNGGFIDMKKNAAEDYRVRLFYDDSIGSASEGGLVIRTNTDGTNAYNRMAITGTGYIGVGLTAPTARLHLTSGSTTLAPLKLTSGALLTTAQAGSIEYDGTDFYITDGSNVRRTIATATTAGTLDNVSVVSSPVGIALWPAAGNSVTVSATTASTNSTTGALIVKGGMGIAGNLYSSGTIITSSNIQGASITATSGMIAPYIAGSTASGGALLLDSTTHASKGNISLIGETRILANSSDAEGFKFYHSYSNNETSTRLAFAERQDNQYGWSLVDAGIDNPVLGGQTMTGLSAGTLNFVRHEASGAGVPALTIDRSNGYIGIGSGTPTRLLDLYESAKPTLRIRSASNDPSSGPTIRLVEDLTENGAWVRYQTINNNLELGVVESGVDNTRLSISRSTGNVGIGTSTPSYPLAVSGTIHSSSGGFRFPDNSTQTTAAISSQWVSVTSGIHYSSGWVGVNTSTMKVPFSVNYNASVYDPTDTDIPTYAAAVLTASGPAETASGVTKPVLVLARAISGAWPAVARFELGRYNVVGGNANTMMNIKLSQTGIGNEGDNTPLVMSLQSSGNVGIATTTAGSRLTIRGAGSSAATSGLNVTDFANNPILFVRDDGRVGIGTSSPAGVLDVNGGTTGNKAINLVAGDSTNVGTPGGAVLISAGDASSGSTSGGTVSIISGNAGGGSSYGGNILLMPGTGTFGSGKVGIGTSSPMSILSVEQNINNDTFANITNNSTGVNARAGFVMTNAGTSYGSNSAGILLSGVSNSTTPNQLAVFSNSGVTSGVHISASTGGIRFATGATERMRVDSSGNIGIGTSSPAYKLEVLGGARLVAANNSDFWTERTDSDFDMRQGSGSTKRLLSLHAASTGGDLITAYANTAGSYNMAFQVKNNHYIGIGGSAGGNPVEVSGTVNIHSSGVLKFGGTQVCTSAGCTASSDKRLKENIKPLDFSLEKLLSLNAVQYDWKDKNKFGAQHEIGLIAQDLEKVYPEVVHTQKDTGFKSVSYDKLVAPIIEALKVFNKRIMQLFERTEQHSREIASVKEENAALKARVEKSEKENEELRKRLDRIEKALAK